MTGTPRGLRGTDLHGLVAGDTLTFSSELGAWQTVSLTFVSSADGLHLDGPHDQGGADRYVYTFSDVLLEDLGNSVPGDTLLRLRQGRFEITLERTAHDGRSGPGRFASISGSGSQTAVTTEDSGLLLLFSSDTREMLVKVPDGCAINGHHWVFTAAATDVGTPSPSPTPRPTPPASKVAGRAEGGTP